MKNCNYYLSKNEIKFNNEIYNSFKEINDKSISKDKKIIILEEKITSQKIEHINKKDIYEKVNGLCNINYNYLYDYYYNTKNKLLLIFKINNNDLLKDVYKMNGRLIIKPIQKHYYDKYKRKIKAKDYSVVFEFCGYNYSYSVREKIFINGKVSKDKNEILKAIEEDNIYEINSKGEINEIYDIQKNII